MSVKCNGEELLGQMLELLKEPGDVRKTEFVARASRRLGLSRYAARAILDEAIGRGYVFAARRFSAKSADRSSLFLARTEAPFVPKGSASDEDRGKNSLGSGFVSSDVDRLPVAEVWMDIPISYMPYQVSNYGRLRRLQYDKNGIIEDTRFEYEPVELEYDDGSGRFGWNIYCGDITRFVYRDELLERFAGIRCIVNPVDEMDAIAEGI